MTYYTDGGCEPNPGKGVWTWICKETHDHRSGTDENTTSSRMELLGVLNAIKDGLEKELPEITIFSDSTYVVNSFNDWMDKWAKSKKRWESKKNTDIFTELYKIKHFSKIKIHLHWVKGHNGDKYNEMADQMVRTIYEEEFGGIMKH